MYRNSSRLMFWGDEISRRASIPGVHSKWRQQHVLYRSKEQKHKTRWISVARVAGGWSGGWTMYGGRGWYNPLFSLLP